MRAFIAIDTKEVEDFLKDINSHIRAKTVTAYHLTLKFLGEMPENKIDAVIDALDKINFDRFSLTLSEIGFFPNPRRPRVIWVGVKPWKDVITLQKDIDSAMHKVGFSREKKFHPHITLARVRNKFSMDSVMLEPRTISVESFKLIKSTLTSEGPVYETVKTFINKP